MSFAVIQTGGKQYKVSASEILKIERLNNEEGKTVEFKNVLFLNDDKTTEIGNPNIQGAKVEATILKNTKNKTILVFKKRRRKNSRKKFEKNYYSNNYCNKLTFHLFLITKRMLFEIL